MTKEKLKNLKKREQAILKKEIEMTELNDKYILATWDYDSDKLKMPLREFVPNSPLWDWFTLYNKKTKKVWYTDFTFPYITDYFLRDSFEKAIDLASSYIFFNNVVDSDKFPLNDYEDRSKHIEKIKKINNWDLTFKDYKTEVEKNKNWNEGVKVIKNSKNKNDRDIVIVAPYCDYMNTDKSFADYFKEVVEIIESGKMIEYHNRKKYLTLIEEIKFNYYPHDKKINPEVFI